MTYFWQNPALQLVSNAAWSTQYVDQLPDSAFLIVRKKCGSKEKGRTHPLACRSLPVKDHKGNYSCSHLRNAEARANQVRGVSEVERRRAKKRASNLYDLHCR